VIDFPREVGALLSVVLEVELWVATGDGGVDRVLVNKSAIVLRLLGRVSAVAQGVGWSWVIHAGRAGIRFADGLCRSLGYVPLSVRTPDLRLDGYFGQRVYLDCIAAGKYEALCQELFLSAVGPESIVVDGGAHAGLYSVLASRRRGRVYAYEPDPQTFRLLTHNLRVNGCGSVVARRVALSDRAGRAPFYRIPAAYGNSLVQRREYLGESRRTWVETVTLDHDLAGLPAGRLVVKLDLEGHEPIALRGMRNLLARAQAVVMLIEVNPQALSNLQYQPAKLISDLRDHGLAVGFIDERTHTVVSPESCPKGNLYCTRGL
jgi:FkbM family methyltransferase